MLICWWRKTSPRWPAWRPVSSPPPPTIHTWSARHSGGRRSGQSPCTGSSGPCRGRQCWGKKVILNYQKLLEDFLKRNERIKSFNATVIVQHTSVFFSGQNIHSEGGKWRLYLLILGMYGGLLYLLTSHPVVDPWAEFDGSFMSIHSPSQGTSECQADNQRDHQDLMG